MRQLPGLPADEAAAPPQQLGSGSSPTQNGADYGPHTTAQQHRNGSKAAHEVQCGSKVGATVVQHPCKLVPCAAAFLVVRIA